MAASNALRNNLDASDQILQSLMTQLEQVVNTHLSEPGPDNIRTGTVVKVEATRVNNTGAARTFP